MGESKTQYLTPGIKVHTIGCARRICEVSRNIILQLSALEEEELDSWD